MAAEDMRDRAVRQEVRVTADRRGEMGIGRETQAEMAGVHGAVERERHAFEQDALQHPGVIAALDGRHERGVVLGVWLFPAAEREAELGQQGAHLFELLSGGGVVNAIQGRYLVALQEFSGGHIGGQHQLFYEAVGVVALGLMNGRDMSLGVEFKAGFQRGKFNQALLPARGMQDLIKRVQAFERLKQRAVFLWVICPREQCRHFGIREPRRRANDGPVKRGAAGPPGGVDLQFTYQAEPIHFRFQGTQVV